MRSLGYRTQLRNVGYGVYGVFSASERATHPGSRVQATVESWFADYPGASNFYIDFLCTV